MNKRALYLPVLLLCSALPSFATSSICDAAPGNIVANCGFEGGTYSSTIGGNTNNSVPNSWTPNAGYDLQSNFNYVGTGSNSGSYAQSIGNYDAETAPFLSQTLTDVAGATYAGSLFVAYGGAGGGDTGAYFDTQIDGTSLVSLSDTASGSYTQYTFSFVGTGSDVLSFGGDTNPSEWFVDDIDVYESAGPTTPPVMGATPEPSSLILLATASGPLFFLRQRLARR